LNDHKCLDGNEGEFRKAKEWLRNESLGESENLPDPDIFAREIVQDLEAALEQFREITEDLEISTVTTQR
jgi:hypothetical protein